MYAIFYRSLLALLVAFGLSALLGPVILPLLTLLHSGERSLKQFGKLPKPEQPPTMGGMLLLFAVVVSSLIFGHDSYAMLLKALLITALFGLIGFAEDFFRLTMEKPVGWKTWQKLTAQGIVALLFAVLLYASNDVGPTLWFDQLDIGLFYIPFAMLVLLATVNAVDWTDGQDGLVPSVTAIYAIAMTALLCSAVMTAPAGTDPAWLKGQSALSAFCGATGGACVGFLLYNAYPAKVRMGKTGSYTLGGAIAVMALLSRSTLLLPLMGVCFVASAGSVLLQIASFRLCGGKQIFRATPLHRHLRESGMEEPKIVSLYRIVTIVCSAGALLLYWFLH